MSQEAVASKTKEKKAKRDAERKLAGAGKKRKRHQETEALPEGVDDGAEDAAGLEPDTISATVPPSSKKRKRTGDEAAGEPTIAAKGDQTAGEPAAKKKKKRRNAKSTATSSGDSGDAVANANGYVPTKSRFILFIGNLPYTTTDASLHAHFKKLQPFTLRHRTDPQTKRSKGFAFLEFENYDRMETCLKKYHHSMFDPEEYREAEGKFSVSQKGPRRGEKTGGRKINVELTAGGGGKSAVRQEKIKLKNNALEEQRKRRAEAELKERIAADKTGKLGLEERARRKKAREEAGRDVQVERIEAGGANEGMHPSRLARMQG
jgi:nucleolar protein 6